MWFACQSGLVIVLVYQVEKNKTNLVEGWLGIGDRRDDLAKGE